LKSLKKVQTFTMGDHMISVGSLQKN